MRTLSRPMFNMGGPIKQGVMHGIREPYKDGSIVGGHQSPALAGAHPWKDKSGREHHVIPALWASAAGLARFAPSIYKAAQAGLRAGKFGRTYNLGKLTAGAGRGATGAGAMGTSGAPTNVGRQLMNIKQQGLGSKFMGALPAWARTSLQRDPIFKGLKWGKEAITGPTAKTWGKKIVQGATTPTGALTIGYFGGKWLWPDGTEATDKEVKEQLNKKGGVKDEVKVTLTQEQRDAKAKADKEKRINELLDTMGYDKARKNAAYDALIDAGRMISERGTLDPKNIGRELIDPIVATTSARFDKPEQIREAVGLMQVKADIAKQMEDPQVAEQRRLNIEVSKKGLGGPDFKEVITNKIIKGEAASGGTLAQILRATEGIDAKVIDTAKKPQGKDALDWVTEIVKKSHEEGTPHPAGTFVVSNRVLIIDEQGNITPYL